jgi:hypothetical protein
VGLVLEPRDLEKLATAFFDNLRLDNSEYGGIGLDPKRPFGNSNVEHDILNILEHEPEGPHGAWTPGQHEYAAALYRNLIPHLQKKYGSKAKKSSTVQAPAAVAAPKKEDGWEYKVDAIGWNDGVEERLNTLGTAGYELVAFSREGSYYKAVFKKRKA